MLNYGEDRRAFHFISHIYHFGVKVLHILGVENSHESLCAYCPAATFLANHECYVLWVVLKVVDE